jgi:hypothetical protein
MWARTPMPRPTPRAKRPPESRKRVVARLASTSGCRVSMFVAPVPIQMSCVTAAAAPQQAPTSLTSNRSDTQAEPRPSASASRTSCNRSEGRSVWPGSR